MIDFFHSFSNLVLGIVQLKYQRAKRLKFFLLKSSDPQRAPGMSYVSFKVQKCPIFEVLNLKKENCHYFSNIYCRHTIEILPERYSVADLNIQPKYQDFKTKGNSRGHKEITLLPRDKWHSKSQKMIFDAPSLKPFSFMDLRLLVGKL